MLATASTSFLRSLRTFRPSLSPLSAASSSASVFASSSIPFRSYSTPTPTSTPADASTQPTGLDEGERAIYNKLKSAFPGQRLEVQDVSGGCGSFYAILISSPAFKGLSTIKQHKLVNSCLKEDIKDIHGLQLKTIPEE